MPDFQQLVETLAQTAVAHAQQQFGAHLDYSRESIDIVETILTDFYRLVPRGRIARFLHRKPDFHDVARIANTYGAYLGEVIRRSCGGEWTETGLCGCEHILVLRIGPDLSLMPTTKTWNRLTMGPTENVITYFRRTLARAASLGNTDSARSANAS